MTVMAHRNVRSLQLMLGAALLSLAGLAAAQAEPAKEAASAAPAAAVEGSKAAAKKHHHKGHHHKGHRHHKDHHHGDARAEREAAGAKGEARKVKPDDDQALSQYERNAFARCQVFKVEVDRRACAERVKSGAARGSVEEGGILREATVEQVIR